MLQWYQGFWCSSSFLGRSKSAVGALISDISDTKPRQNPTESQRGWTQMEAKNDVGSGWCFWLRSWWALDMHSMRPFDETRKTVCHMKYTAHGVPIQVLHFESQRFLTSFVKIGTTRFSIWKGFSSDAMAAKMAMPTCLLLWLAVIPLCAGQEGPYAAYAAYAAYAHWHWTHVCSEYPLHPMLFSFRNWTNDFHICSVWNIMELHAQFSWHLLRPGATNQEKPGEYLDCIDEFSVHLLLSHGLPRQLLQTDPWGWCCESSWSNGASLAWRRWHADFCGGLFDACTFDWQLPAPLRGADFLSVRNEAHWSPSSRFHMFSPWYLTVPEALFHVFTLVPERFGVGKDGSDRRDPCSREQSVRWVFFRSPWWLSLSAICLASSSQPVVALLSPGRSEMLVLRRKDWHWLVF